MPDNQKQKTSGRGWVCALVAGAVLSFALVSNALAVQPGGVIDTFIGDQLRYDSGYKFYPTASRWNTELVQLDELKRLITERVIEDKRKLLLLRKKLKRKGSDRLRQNLQVQIATLKKRIKNGQDRLDGIRKQRQLLRIGSPQSQPSGPGAPDSGSSIELIGQVTGGGFEDVDTIDRKGEFVGVSLGARTRISTDTVAGVIFNYRHANNRSSIMNARLRSNDFGFGLFLNTILQNRVKLGLAFDYSHGNARARFGASAFNRGTIHAKFDTNAVSFAAQISRRWWKAPWLWIEPVASVSYTSKKRSGFTDSTGVRSGGRTIELGRLTAGGKFGRTFFNSSDSGDGTALSHTEIYAGVKGVFDFVREDNQLVAIATTNVFADTDPLGVKLLGGANFVFNGGTALSIALSYLTMGDFNAVQGQARLSVPLN